MLEAYFVKPTTIDRIRACWIGAEVERYMIWLDGQGYRPRSVLRRVPMVVAFGEFAYVRGARSVQDLPEHVEPFVRQWLARSRSERAGLAKEVRGPVEQMLRVVLPDFVGTGRPHHGVPFAESVPGFFD